MTPEMRKSELKGFERLQNELGGIIPSKLRDKQTLLIETSLWMYKLKVMDTTLGRRFTLETQSPLCKTSEVIVHMHAHLPKLKYEKKDWIGKGMKLVFKFTDGNSVMIGDVKSVVIGGIGEDGNEYSFDFWQ